MTLYLTNSLLEAIDGLEAAIGLDDCQENLIHSLIVFGAVDQGHAVKIKSADLGDLVEKSFACNGRP